MRRQTNELQPDCPDHRVSAWLRTKGEEFRGAVRKGQLDRGIENFLPQFLVRQHRHPRVRRGAPEGCTPTAAE
jgi:hypothetical protein